MAILHRAGHDLYFEVHGTGAPILGIHGSPSAAVFWEDAARELAMLGRCIIYDRQGYGRSAWPDQRVTVDLDEQLDDAVALLDHVGGEPAVVVGRSTGGQIALALAVRHPAYVRALVLLEPAVFTVDATAHAWANELREVVLAAAQADPATAARDLLEHVLGPDAWSGLPQGAREVFAAGSAAMLAEVRGQGLDLSADPFAPTAEDLAGVDQPTLVLSAEDSYAAGRAVDDRLAAALPNARHEVVTGGHLIHPAHSAVVDFVEDVLRAG